MGNKVFYDSNKKVDIQTTMSNVNGDYKGTTMDGYSIYHWTYYDTRRECHISYDTVVVNGEHEYIMGSGHETKHGSSSISKWDFGNSQTWQDARTKYLKDLLQRR